MKERDKIKSFNDNNISKIKKIIKRISNESSKQIKNNYGNLFHENKETKK